MNSAEDSSTAFFQRHRTLIDHLAPFAAWLILMEALPRTAGSYALRTLVCAGLFLWLRPWRHYGAFHLRHLPLALLTGVVVWGLWILPELSFWREWPAFEGFYRRWAILPPWETFSAPAQSVYVPEVAGWPLALMRLAGSALVIAVIEEYFWRGFLYRRLMERDISQVALDRFQLGAFALTALLFGLEHTRWLVGIIAGLAYGALVLRTCDLHAAVVAHVVTNLLLGLYVLAAGAYGFW
ncbi:MAG: CAAX prenyl protease-related protein [Geoalkalibacter sp.]|jgi:CAAX prenyl protease-like protein|uniref:CAAX prenyl protease-related protein n=1 Tax=Geoalkalibacter sp. TaxID=3041440 RepID=UPI002A999D6F|nr:CAAX prenyl protease-related protein [Thermodesulfobacteriota bacterium]